MPPVLPSIEVSRENYNTQGDIKMILRKNYEVEKLINQKTKKILMRCYLMQRQDYMKYKIKFFVFY